MVLAVDVGNTNIVLGGYENGSLKFTSRIATESSKMEDQYAIDFADILKLYGYVPAHFDGVIISSVVPQLIFILKKALQKLLKCKVLTVEPGIKTGLNIKIDNAGALGADLVCAAVGALEKFEAPMILFDLGTATTITAINEKKELIGGAIIPGVKISLNALSSRTAQLPHIDTELNGGTVIGTNTVDCMKSGIVLGTASMIDGMIGRYKEILGENAKVIVSGGLAKSIAIHCREKLEIDQNLLLDGLYLIYKKNC